MINHSRWKTINISLNILKVVLYIENNNTCSNGKMFQLGTAKN